MRFKRFPKLGLEGSFYLICCSIISTLLNLVLPFSILIIFDRILPNSAQSSLWLLFIIILLAVILDGIISQIEQVFVSLQIKRFESHITKGIFHAISHANLSRFSQLSSGEYLERISMIHAIKNFFGGDSIKASINALTSAITIIVIYFIDTGAGLTVLTASFILFLFARHLSKSKINTLPKKSYYEGQTNSKVLEIVSNPTNLKASAMEMRMENLMSNLVKTRERRSTEYEELDSQFNLMLTLIQHVTVSLVVVHCAVSVISQDISQGVMAAVILLTNRYFAPYQQIMHTLSRWKINEVYLNRLNELLELDEFTVNQTDTNLRLINLEVPSFNKTLALGQLCVLSGPSCSGKTYLSQCITREREEHAESIKTNGKPIQNIPYKIWREQVIHINRSSSFIEGTIIDNITCFQPALHKAAYALCEAMQIKHTIDELRQGFYTEFRSTNTVPLPRQVIYALVIIRAVLSRKSIIIIDDLDLIYDTRFVKNLVTCIRPRSDAFICIFVSNRLHEIYPKLEHIVLPQRSLKNQARNIEPKHQNKNDINKDIIA